MAKEMTYDPAGAEQEKAKLKEERKQLKKDQKAQRKEAKRRAAEIAKQEEALGEDSGNGIVTLAATLLIVVLWLAVICVVVKLDIGGFGSGVLTPILKDVPVLNKILPGSSNITETVEPDSYGGYTSLEEAVAYIRQLELELERAQNSSNAKDADIEVLMAEVRRLQEFEKKQDEFQRVKTEFFEKAVEEMGADEYEKYFSAMDPTTAAYIYRQVLLQNEATKEIESYVQGYTAMKPKEAAKIFDSMTDNFTLVAKILKNMDAESRGKILAAMGEENAARITKKMDPDS